MAQQLYFSRDSIMRLQIGTKTWKIPVLEGFSFSQATNVSEISLNEMARTAGVSRRGRRAFNDSLAPVDFSFGTYIRPFKSAGSGTGAVDDNAYHHAVEEALWALFSGPATHNATAFDFTNQTTHDGTNLDIDFSESNKSTLGPTAGATLYFELGDANKVTYKLSNIVLNEASIDFDIDGVASIQWSGFADTITQHSSTRVVTPAVSSSTTVNISTTDTGTLVVGQEVSGTGIVGTPKIASITDNNTFVLSTSQTIANNAVLTFGPPAADYTEGTTATNNFIRNRLTTLTVDPVDRDPGGTGSNVLEDDYVLTLTGGNITLSNNVTYLTPEELGVVNVPIGHVTGTRAFGGSFTCYLSDDTATTTASKDFFDDVTAIREVVSNQFNLVFCIGGGTTASPVTPSLQINAAKCHVDIPTHSIEDIITLETTFQALPTSIDDTDEVTLVYYGPTPA